MEDTIGMDMLATSWIRPHWIMEKHIYPKLIFIAC